MPAHRTQNSRRLQVEAVPAIAPSFNIISPTPRAFTFPEEDVHPSSGSLYDFQSNHSCPNLHLSLLTPQALSSPLSLSPTHSRSSSLSSTLSFSPCSNPRSLSPSSAWTSSPLTSLSPSPTPERADSPGGAWPYPLPPHSNGQPRLQPPRPPNPWICFRNMRSQQFKHEQDAQKIAKGEKGRRPRQADLSKQIAAEWKALSEEEKAVYVRMSDEQKLEHAKLYPGYKYRPRRKGAAAAESKKADSKRRAEKIEQETMEFEFGPVTSVEAGASPAGAEQESLQLGTTTFNPDGDASMEFTALDFHPLYAPVWDVSQSQEQQAEHTLQYLDPNVPVAQDNQVFTFDPEQCYEPAQDNFPFGGEYTLDLQSGLLPFEQFNNVELGLDFCLDGSATAYEYAESPQQYEELPLVMEDIAPTATRPEAAHNASEESVRTASSGDTVKPQTPPPARRRQASLPQLPPTQTTHTKRAAGDGTPFLTGRFRARLTKDSLGALHGSSMRAIEQRSFVDGMKTSVLIPTASVLPAARCEESATRGAQFVAASPVEADERSAVDEESQEYSMMFSNYIDVVAGQQRRGSL